MATNRIDILDSALLRPGRIDRKIEFPPPNEEVPVGNLYYTLVHRPLLVEILTVGLIFTTAGSSGHS